MAATPSSDPLFLPGPAVAFLKALAKDLEGARFRAIRKGHDARKMQGFNPQALEAQQAQGRNLYVVINDGGDKAADITACRAIWCEWDDRPIEWQKQAWRELGLPEPSLMVATGGKSIHAYWVFKEPVHPENWRPLQLRLIAAAGSDPSVKDPSRVMRLPGSSYISADGTVTGRAEIIQTSSSRYSLRELERFLPALPAPPAPAPLLQAPPALPPATGAPIPFRDFLSKAAATLIETGSREGSCNDDGLRLSLELVAVERWLQAQGAATDETARDAFACYLSHCPDTIGGRPLDLKAAWDRFDGAADRHPAPATPEEKLLQRLAYHRRQSRKVVELRPSPVPAQPKPSRKPKQQSATGHVRALALDHHEILDNLPKRIGQPRLNIRTRDVHLPDRILSGDEAARLYLDLSNPMEKWPKEATFDAVQAHAARAQFDPVAEYLEGLETTTEPLPMEEWTRLDQVLLNIDDPVAAAFLPRFFITAVARTFQPGCIGRQWPVLIGEKGIGKSDLPKLLFNVPGLPEGFVDNPGDLQRDGLMKAHRSWCVELAELNGITRRSDKEHLKAFLSERTDTYRAPYSRAPASHPRRFVFWGTSNGPPMNESDPRFVCIPLPDRMLPFTAVAAARDALWARAMEQYRARVCWHTVSDEFKTMLRERNDDHTVTDPWADQVEAFLDDMKRKGLLPVKIPELMGQLKLDNSQRNNAVAVRLVELAGSLGWFKGRRRLAPGGEPRQGLWPKDWRDK